MSAGAIPLPTRILLAEAVNLVKDALRRGTDRERQSLASNKIYSALCEGDLESRAGYVTCKSQKAWVLTNWNIPPELWRVVTLFLFDKNEAKVWAFPANLPIPQGWPNLGAITDQTLRDDPPVRMTEIKVVSDGILRRLGLWRGDDIDVGAPVAPAMSVPEGGASRPRTRRAGAPPAADWLELEVALENEIEKVGPPHKGAEIGWRTKADIVRFIEARCGADEPGKTALKTNTSKMLARIRTKREMAGKSETWV